MSTARKRRGFSDKDLREVSDSPELTKADFAKAKPFAEVFPDPFGFDPSRSRPQQSADQETGIAASKSGGDSAFQKRRARLAVADR